MLTLERIATRYGRVSALEDVTLAVNAGELVCLIGANGAGKTTTLKTISGLLRPAAGRIIFDGAEIHALPPREILRRGIAHCPEGRRVFPYMTVQENLEMGAYVRADARAVAPDLERRAILSAAIRSSAMFALVAAFGNTFGATRSAHAQTVPCSQGEFPGDASGGGRNEGTAKQQARIWAERFCARDCSLLSGCSEAKPACLGTAHVISFDCSPNFFGGWECSARYRCTCGCGKS
jgi:ABC-type sugar transport system ATPase subunit